MSVWKYISLIVLLWSASSCNKEKTWDCIKTTGEEVIEQRDLASFCKIDIKDGFTVDIVQDSIDFVLVRGGKNILPKIATEVKDEVLYLSNENACNSVRSFKRELVVEVHTKNLQSIYTEGVGEIKSIDTLVFSFLELEAFNAVGTVSLLLKVDSFSTIIHSGSLDVEVQGQANNAYLYNAGHGYFLCKDFEVNDVHVNHNSTGKVEVVSRKSFEVENEGTGEVYYWGSPTEVVISNQHKNNVFAK